MKFTLICSCEHLKEKTIEINTLEELLELQKLNTSKNGEIVIANNHKIFNGEMAYQTDKIIEIYDDFRE